MIRIYILSLIFVFGSTAAISQSDTLDQTNSNGEKTGWWIIYLNNDLKQLKDSVGATHCRYAFYIENVDQYNIGIHESNERPVKLTSGEIMRIGNLNLLDGVYFSYYENGSAKFVLTTKNGFPIKYKEYYSNNKIKTHSFWYIQDGAPVHGTIFGK